MIKYFLSSVFFMLALLPASHGQGLLIVDASTAETLPVTYDSVFVQVQDQVASVIARHTFFNEELSAVEAKYAFAVPSGASVTGLRWQIAGVWEEAEFSAEPVDTDLPGSGSGSTAPILSAFLGEQPFYFTFNDPLPAQETITIELEFVMLLPYTLGTLSFDYKHDLSGIQNENLDEFYLEFNLDSQRSIITMDCPLSTSSSWTDNAGEVIVSDSQQPGQADVHVEYEVNNDELGLFSFSTFLTPEAQPDCDTIPPGFFGFIAEPPVSEDVEVISKVFTLIIDRSGSMDGLKIQQAKEAASFIVDNMNFGDYFNIVDFSEDISSWQEDHVEFNVSSMNSALDYIDDIQSGGSTNISGSFDVAIPQFENDSEDLAHIIIFFTDGEAYAGITETPELLSHISGLRNFYDPNLIIFTFGIGPSVNENLLANIASSSNGLFEMVENADLFATISQFYLLIQNPVLLNTELTFDPPIVTEVYPYPLQNLYMGQQLMVFGRYEVPQPITVTLSGDAFGQEVEYTYYMDLADGMIASNAFLTSMWADQKIRSLQGQYYLSTDPTEQGELQQEIIDLSLCFGVVSDFTSLSDNEDDDNPPLGLLDFEHSEIIQTIFAHPNPFKDFILLDLHSLQGETVTVQLFNMLGVLVAEMQIPSAGYGEIRWDISAWKDGLTTGTYLLKVSTDTQVFNQKLLRL